MKVIQNYPRTAKRDACRNPFDDEARWATARCLLHEDIIRTEGRLAGLRGGRVGRKCEAASSSTTLVEEEAVVAGQKLQLPLPGPLFQPFEKSCVLPTRTRGPQCPPVTVAMVI